jgi:SAM-dependent methyltransferase
VNIARSYSNQIIHARISSLIREHSENKTDIRIIANEMIDWESVHRLIDLGCGYGWFEEALKDSIKKNLDLIAGIDYLSENSDPFLQCAKKISREAVFKKVILPAPLDFPSDYFDLAVCSYSLYDFRDIFREVKRILRKDGIFLVITHSERMLEEGKRFFDFNNLRTVIENFSAENGESILGQYFSRLRSIDYPNSLIFHKGEDKDLAEYINFKYEFIRKDADPDLVRETMVNELNKNGILSLNKNDKIFLVKK